MSTASNDLGDGVLLLHGLCRTNRSMEGMSRALQAQGYRVLNLGYASRAGGIETLAEEVLEAGFAAPVLADCPRIHVVTHSMGGILLRAYLARHRVPRLGRVVMLAPPNRGSELVDRFGRRAWFRRLHGPAGTQLGTALGDLPRRLGPVDFELGVIAGDGRFLQPGSWFLPRPNDGKVSVLSTRVRGMKEHLTVHAGHTFLMDRPEVQAHTLQFLRTGSFHSWIGRPV